MCTYAILFIITKVSDLWKYVTSSHTCFKCFRSYLFTCLLDQSKKFCYGLGALDSLINHIWCLALPDLSENPIGTIFIHIIQVICATWHFMILQGFLCTQIHNDIDHFFNNSGFNKGRVIHNKQRRTHDEFYVFKSITSVHNVQQYVKYVFYT